jgi:DNA-binding transcriptional LysR family regulator
MNMFVEVAKQSSFRAAADTLGMSSSTLSRNIAELEHSIGVRLLHRTTRRVGLTKAGEEYFARCSGIVDDARNAHQALVDSSERASGTLRILLPSEFASYYVMPLLSDFAQAWPAIRFDFDSGPDPFDLHRAPFDLAIAYGPPPTAPTTLVARRLAELPRYLYASPGYLRQAAALDHPADLVRHVLCVGPFARDPASVWRTLVRGGERVEVAGGSRFVMNSVDVSRAMALHGLGVTSLDPMMVQHDLEQGRLVRVLTEWAVEPIPVYAMTDTRHLPAKTRLFIAFLKERLATLLAAPAPGRRRPVPK